MEGSLTTLILIGITCLVSFLAFENRRLLGNLVLWPPAVTRNHDYSRLLTYAFVHADGTHLLFNMITLYFFGRGLEGFINMHLGAFGFAFFYLSAVLAAIMPTYLSHREDTQYYSLGASGGVSAVLFACILLRPWSTIIVFFIPMPAIIYGVLYLGYTIWMERSRKADNVNHSAHLWGAVYGILFMVLMDPRVVALFLDGLAHPVMGDG